MTHTKGGTVYILTNKTKTTLYTGVTSDINSRIRQHKNKFYPRSFSARYNVNNLIYFENFSTIEEAIEREKKIKAKSRKNKEKLINSINPEWKDLSAEIHDW